MGAVDATSLLHETSLFLATERKEIATKEVCPPGPYPSPHSATASLSLPTKTGVIASDELKEWRFGLFECCNRLDTCCLGLCCPCILFGRTARLLDSATESVHSQQSRPCLVFLGLHGIGVCLNLLNLGCIQPLPFYTRRTRTGIRHQLQLKGHGRCFLNFANWALCSEYNEEAPAGEDCERVCDFAVHYFCLPCALCQEAQEVQLSMISQSNIEASPVTAPTEQVAMKCGA